MAKEEDLNASLWALARRSENDAVAMRIITVITLIYLPAAFVSVSLTALASLSSDGGISIPS